VVGSAGDDQGGKKTHTNNKHDVPVRGQLKRLDAGEMQDEKARPQHEHVPQTDEAEKQRHADPPLVSDALLHHDGVGAVQHGRDQGHAVAEGDFARRLVREGSPVFVVVAAEVDGRDEDDAGERGEHAQQFPNGEFFDGEDCAEQQGEDAAGAGQDGAGCDGRVFQAGGHKVVRQEPQQAELQTQPGRLAERQWR